MTFNMRPTAKMKKNNSENSENSVMFADVF